jgi:primosomal protein N' (replication factor Y) (superfamily II helicase)
MKDLKEELNKIIIAQALLDSSNPTLQEQLFEYIVPNHLESKTKIGSLALMPFGKQLMRGLIINLTLSSPEELNQDYELKYINEILKESIFEAEYLDLLLWISDFYLCSFWQTLKGILPIGLLGSFQERVFIQINSLEDLVSLKIKVTPKEEKLLNLLLNSVQKNLAFTFLRQQTKDTTFRQTIKNLITKNLITVQTQIKKAVKPALKKENTNLKLQKNKLNIIKLNTKQEEIFDNLKVILDQEKFEDYLLHGITGSGKTEIYFSLITEVLKKEKQVIYLVPEIALTVQLLERVYKHFPPEQVSIWHSNLSAGERILAWNECLNNSARLIIGARSAIFAPVNNLGLIIIDEEHDASYKSGFKPFYDTKQIALQRAKLNNALLLSGSATPSIKNYFFAKENHKLLSLKNRFNNKPLPKVQIIDMRIELQNNNRSIFSRSLKQALDKCILKKEQAILLLNKRGHSNYVFCRDCGYVTFCKNCSVPMIYHLTDNSLHCHHCNFRQAKLTVCPDCNSLKIKESGLGTQKLEAELKKTFPMAEILRLDRDISSKREGVQEIWNQLISPEAENKAQFLVGTQLVAKGIDLPRVSVVGVVHSEAGLYLPDYTAAERSFQLLTQAAGRAGRHDKDSNIIFQTYIPEHEIIQFAANQDYEAFYNWEIEQRKTYNYTPFCELTRFILSNENESIIEKEIEKLKDWILLEAKMLGITIELLGPAPCPYEKLNKLFRWHILIKHKQIDINSIRQIYKEIKENYRFDSRLAFDLMPISLL